MLLFQRSTTACYTRRLAPLLWSPISQRSLILPTSLYNRPGSLVSTVTLSRKATPSQQVSSRTLHTSVSALSLSSDQDTSPTEMTLPARPSSALSSFGQDLQAALKADIDAMQGELSEGDATRDQVYKSTRPIFVNTENMLFALRTGDWSDDQNALFTETATALNSILSLLGGSTALEPHPREGNLSQAIQQFAQACLLQQFFLTGRLAPPTALHGIDCSDEEYLQACLAVAQELARYSVARAVEGDTDSIALCRRLCTDLNEEMLEFDLRNGNLRRTYDGLKYAVKKIEEVTYELSLLQSEAELGKRKRGEEEGKLEPGLVDSAVFEQIKGRYDAYDKLREQVIKDSRDVQKLAKQAIFSLHRAKLGDARKQVTGSAAAARPIMSVVQANPGLRNGSFGNSLEEWAEAAMTLEWAEKERILNRAEMSQLAGIEINTKEYVGALSDFTGEIGRMAVAAASRRDLEYVKKVHMACLIIASAFTRLNVSGKFKDKSKTVTSTLKKMEGVVYELSLLKMGGRQREREAEPEPKEGDAGDS